jgi:hypothetical protein
VAVEVFADRFVGRAGKLHPFRPVGAAGTEGCFIDAEGFARDTLGDGHALAIFASGAWGAEDSFAIAGTVGQAALHAVADADFEAWEAHVGEADSGIKFAPFKFVTVGVVEALYAFVVVDVAN